MGRDDQTLGKLRPGKLERACANLTQRLADSNLKRMSDRANVLTKPDPALEVTLRPSFFSEFTGQAKVKERLERWAELRRERHGG